MTIACFLHVDGPPGQHEALQAWADECFGPALIRSGQVQEIEAYTPRSVDDPYLGRESGKLLIVEARFATVAELEAAFASAPVAAALSSMPKGGDADGKFRVTAEAFTVRHFPLLDGSSPPRRAPVSFVVRYYRPIENETLFNEHYFAHHPPIMVRFPRIRNILCYEPVTWRDANQITPTNSFLGNEIVFDTIEDLDAALSSDARHELREDYHGFPPHHGQTSHHAMQRRPLK